MTYLKSYLAGILAILVGAFLLFPSCSKSGQPAIVKPGPLPPTVAAMADTDIAILDTLSMYAQGTPVDGDSIIGYVWSPTRIDQAKVRALIADSSLVMVDSIFNHAWPDTAEGPYKYYVVAMDNDSAVSSPDSVTVTVHRFPPVLVPMPDTTVEMKDSFYVRVEGHDTNGTIVKYIWALDSIHYYDTTLANTKKTAIATYGAKHISVKAIDNTNQVSAAVLVNITVHTYFPSVTGMKDTLVSENLPFFALATANDTNGIIRTFYWDKGVTGTWTDSTPTGRWNAGYGTSGPLRIRVGVRDNDGLFGYDTFLVHFNHPPSGVVMSSPFQCDTLRTGFDTSTYKWNIRIAWTGTDPDKPLDSLRYKLYIYPAGHSRGAPVYTGNDTIFPATAGQNILYAIEIRAQDRFGDTAWSSIDTCFAPPAGMRHIPAGTFQMGDTVSYLVGAASPLHTVTLSPFYMDTTLVTQEEYQRIMGVNPSFFTGDPRRPVDSVTWYDAVLFCNEKSKRAGMDTVYTYTGISIFGAPGNGCRNLFNISHDFTRNGFRLPTEAEWEYACRAGTTTALYWSDKWEQAVANTYCWNYFNADESSHPVALKLPNNWGLYDMIGNLHEWCNDFYASYSANPQTNPEGVYYNGTRVLRGGWYGGTDERYFHSGSRAGFDPTLTFYTPGFRVVCR